MKPKHCSLLIIILSCLYQPVKAQLCYLGNEGYHVKLSGANILIDAIYYYPGGQVANLSPRDSIAISQQSKNFAQIDWLLITHEHGDHFNDSMVFNYLQKNKTVHVLAPRPVVEKILALNNTDQVSADRLHPIDLKMNEGMFEVKLANNTNIKAWWINHTSKEMYHTVNIAYLITQGDITIFHAGDSEFVPEVFGKLGIDKLPIRYAILPFWFFMDKTTADYILNHFKIQHVVPTHFIPEMKELQTRAHTYLPSGKFLKNDNPCLSFEK